MVGTPFSEPITNPMEFLFLELSRLFTYYYFHVVRNYKSFHFRQSSANIEMDSTALIQPEVSSESSKKRTEKILDSGAVQEQEDQHLIKNPENLNADKSAGMQK